MKIAAFLFLFAFQLSAHAADEFTLKVIIGDANKEYHIEKEKTKAGVYDYFQKKMDRILKMKTHNKTFCERDYIELSTVTKGVKKQTLACARSQEKLTAELVKFSNLVNVEFGKR